MEQTTSTDSTPQENVAKASVCVAVAAACSALAVVFLFASWLQGDYKMLLLACMAWAGAFLMKAVEVAFLRAALKQVFPTLKV